MNARYELEPESGCLLWMGALDGKGYGQVRVAGVLRPAHVVEWEKVHGPVPDAGPVPRDVLEARPAGLGLLGR